MPGKRSLSRNPLIFGLLQKLDLVEQVGSGINRIKGAMKKTGLKEPKFQFGKFFAVTLFRPTLEEAGEIAGKEIIQKSSKKTVEKTVEKILELIRNNPKITQGELVKNTRPSRRGIEWNLAQLKQKGRLKRIGPDKGGHWEVTK